MKKLILLICFIIIALQNKAQDLYDINNIQTIKIFFAYANWDFRLDSAKNGLEGYNIADSVIINTNTYYQVGIKYKGNSTYGSTQNKNPLHIKLDYIINNVNHQNYTDLKLSNVKYDHSFIREVLSYDILSNYMSCPKSNFANVYINNSLYGLYVSSQSVDERFNGDHYFSDIGTFFKCNPIGGAGGANTNYADLKFKNGNDSVPYYPCYELKSDYGWRNLVKLVDTLNNYTTATSLSQIERNIDIDRVLWMHAFNNVLVNFDSYSGSFKQNYYLYRDATNRFLPTVWDLNMSIAGFSGSATSSILLNSTSTNYPLISKILANTTYQKMYLAKVRTMANEQFSSGVAATKAQNLKTQIDNSVNADPYKFFTYANFQSSLTNAASFVPGGLRIGITKFMTDRMAYYNANVEFVKVSPTITNLSYSPSVVNYNSSVSITASISGSPTQVLLGFRHDKKNKFLKTPMYDDGLHNDNNAGDGVYGIDVIAQGSNIQYYLYAENTNAGIFSPARAEFEFHNINVQSIIPTGGDVKLNEFMTVKLDKYRDEYGDKEDWIELYNNSNSLIDLSNLYLSDSVSILNKWKIKNGTTILPNSYKIIWADDEIWQNDLHTNFKLSSIGGTILLSDSNNNILDSVNYGPQMTNMSLSRIPNGTGTWQFTDITYNTFNNLFVSIPQRKLISGVQLFPNPSSDYIIVKNKQSAIEQEIKIYNIQGQLVYEELFYNETLITIHDFKSGNYIAKLNNETIKFIKQ